MLWYEHLLGIAGLLVCFVGATWLVLLLRKLHRCVDVYITSTAAISMLECGYCPGQRSHIASMKVLGLCAAQMVGRAGRTITVRMRRNAVEALESIAKVNVFTDEARQTYRSLWLVLSELATVWNTLAEADRAEIAFQAAGLRQQEFFLALMRDFKTAQEANRVNQNGVVWLPEEVNQAMAQELANFSWRDYVPDDTKLNRNK